jgi:hypothetical protein
MSTFETYNICGRGMTSIAYRIARVMNTSLLNYDRGLEKDRTVRTTL